jgi:hypothetical protein
MKKLAVAALAISSALVSCGGGGLGNNPDISGKVTSYTGKAGILKIGSSEVGKINADGSFNVKLPDLTASATTAVTNPCTEAKVSVTDAKSASGTGVAIFDDAADTTANGYLTQSDANALVARIFVNKDFSVAGTCTTGSGTIGGKPTNYNINFSKGWNVIAAKANSDNTAINYSGGSDLGQPWTVSTTFTTFSNR